MDYSDVDFFNVYDEETNPKVYVTDRVLSIQGNQDPYDRDDALLGIRTRLWDRAATGKYNNLDGLIYFILAYDGGGSRQLVCAGNAFRSGVVSGQRLFEKARLPENNGKWVHDMCSLQPPTGTKRGIKLGMMTSPPKNLAEIVEGLEDLAAGPIPQPPYEFGWLINQHPDFFAARGIQYFDIAYWLYPMIFLHVGVQVYHPTFGNTTLGFGSKVKTRQFGNGLYMFFVGTQSPNVNTIGYTANPAGHVWVILKNSADEVVPDADDFPNIYHLYHVIKQGTEIYPAHGTALWEGQQVQIKTVPLAGRELISFTIDSVEQLPDAIKDYSDATEEQLELMGYMLGQAESGVARVTADVYVSSIATTDEEEFDVPAGIEFFKQFFSDDCYLSSTWAITYSDLPETVEATIDASTGLLRIYVPPDVYNGNPGGVYHIEVLFTGFSETVAKAYKITLLPMPAYGTVWTSKALMAGGAVKDIFEASDNTIYITTAAKVFKTTDLATFTELTLTGSIASYLGNIQEVADGRLILSDRNGIWIKAVGSDEFIRQGQVFTNWSGAPAMRLAAGPDDNYFFAIHSSNTGLVTYIDRFNIADLTTPTARYVNNETMMPLYPAPIRAAENVWCFMVGGAPTAGCALIRWNGSAFALLSADILTDTNGVGAGSFSLDPDNLLTLVVADYASEYKLQMRHSSDAGATWTDAQLSTLPTGSEAISLASLIAGYGVYGQDNRIMRTANDYVTVANVQTLDGTVNVIRKLHNQKLLAGTAGTSTNLYLSEV